MVRVYVAFLGICQKLKAEVIAAGHGEWLLADIQSAVFQFASDGGTMVRDGSHAGPERSSVEPLPSGS